MPNVPSFMGRIRARATCIENGQVVSGQSDFFNLIANQVVRIGEIKFSDTAAIPQSIMFQNSDVLHIDSNTSEVSLTVSAVFSDDSISEGLVGSDGVNFISSNENIVTISDDGVITAINSGNALITARLEGTIALKRVMVALAGDMDSDGLPDDFEAANGLDPNDPIDAFEDQDGDGLSALDEFNAGTDINNADTDGDGIFDGEELVAGQDGFITNPLDADTDGDGINDSLEVSSGSDPTDGNSGNLADVLDSISFDIRQLTLSFNSLDTEVSREMTVVGHLIDGSQLNLTNRSDTNYSSSDLSIASFGLTPGEVFGGQAGTATISVSSNGFSDSIPVTVNRFTPRALSAIDIPGYANDVVVNRDYAYVAAGAAGLITVDVSDRTAPVIINELDTDGVGIDLTISGDTLYLADGHGGVKVFDIGSASMPTLVGHLQTESLITGVAVKGNLLAAASESQGVLIADISDRTSPLLVSTFELSQINKVEFIESFLLATSSVAGVYSLDIEQPSAPELVDSLSMSEIKDISVLDNYAYLARYRAGYSSIKIDEIGQLTEVRSEARFVPRGVSASAGFALFAEQLFGNVAAVVNVSEPDSPFYQSNIDLSEFGDYAGTGIDTDAGYAYITEESFVVRQDYGVTGNTRLFVAQYRERRDDFGIAPQISSVVPNSSNLLVQGVEYELVADATDDVVVSRVEFRRDGQLFSVDTNSPFSARLKSDVAPIDIDIEVVAYDLAGNASEVNLQRYSFDIDTDNDGLGDTEEIQTYSTLPDNPDSDNDRVDDGREVLFGLNPNSVDTDGDGVNDGDEIDQGTDPLNPDVDAPSVVAVLPSEGETNVREDIQIRVTFDEEVTITGGAREGIKLLELVSGDVAPVRVTFDNSPRTLLVTPIDLLKDFSEYQLSVDKVKDSAGNAQTKVFTTRFSTGNFNDTSPPFVQTVSPPDRGDIRNNIPLNSTFSLKFSERISRDSVNENTVYLLDQSSGERVLGRLLISADEQTIQFVPNGVLSAGREYRIVSQNVEDTFGQKSSFRANNYRTGFSSDGEAPVVLGFSVGEGGQEVPQNTPLRVAFNEAIDLTRLNGINVVSQGQNLVLRSRDEVLGSDKRVVELRLAENINSLQPGETYTISVSGVRDLSGNVQIEDTEVDFTVSADSTSQALRFLSSSPYPNQRQVVRNPIIKVRFNTPLDQVSAQQVELYDIVKNRVVSASTFVESGTIIVIQPNEILRADADYVVRQTRARQLKNIFGSVYGSSRSSKIYDFRTRSEDSIDTSGPVIDSWGIAKEATNVPLDVGFFLDFNEALDLITCPIDQDSIRLETNESSIPIVFSVQRSNVNWFENEDSMPVEFRDLVSYDDLPTRDRVLVRTLNNLAPNTQHTLIVSGVCDQAGNPSGELKRTFTTGTETNRFSPSIVSVTPADGSINVPVDSKITWRFSEPVFLRGSQFSRREWAVSFSDYIASVTSVGPEDTVNIGVWWTQSGRSNRSSLGDTCNADRVESNSCNRAAFLARGKYEWNSDHTELTFTPDFNLPYETEVQTYIDSRGINDSQENELSQGVYFRTYFTTEDLDSSGVSIEDFSVTSITPVDGSVDIAGGTPITITFSHPIPHAFVNSDNFVLYANGRRVDSAIRRSSDARTVKMTTTNIPSGAIVAVLISDAVEDIYGRSAGYRTSLYSTAANSRASGQRPKVSAMYPNQGAQNTNQDRNIILYVSEAVNRGTASDQNLAVVENGRVIDGIWSFSNSDRVLTFSPARDFLPGSLVQVFFENGILNDIGSPFETFQGSFSVSEVEDEFKVLAASPVSNAPSNLEVSVLFNQNLDPLSIHSDSVRVIDIADGNVVTTSANLAGNGRVLKISNSLNWSGAVDAVYRVELRGLESQAGATLASYDLSFSVLSGTELDSAPPTLIRSFPLDGAKNVPINTKVEMIFSERINSLTFGGSTASEAGSLLFSADNKSVTYALYTPFESGQDVNFDLPFVEDLAGNIGQDQSISFSTSVASNAFDVSAPKVIDFYPPNNSKGNSRSTVVSITFDEPIDPESINSTTLFMYRNSLTDRVVSDIGFSQDFRTVYLTPASELEPNRYFTINLTSASDQFGNVTQARRVVDSFFKTDDQIDTTAPELIDMSFSDGAQNMPVNSEIQLLFDEPISVQSLSEISLFENGVRQDIEAHEQSEGGRKVQIFLEGYRFFKPNSEYWVEVGGVSDRAGNIRSTQVTRVFHTGESAFPVTSNPLLIDSTPYSGDGNVPVGTSIRLKFDQKLNRLDALHTRKYVVMLGCCRNRPTFETDAFIENGDTLVLRPKEALQVGRDYRIRDEFLFSILPLSISGGKYSSDGVYSFDVTDEQSGLPPTILKTSFNDGAVGLPTNSEFVADFSKNLNNVECPVIEGVRITDLTGTIVPIDASLIARDTSRFIALRERLIVRPRGGLMPNSNYELRFIRLCDYLSQQVETQQVFRFSTGSGEDVNAPILINRTPVGIDVNRDTNIVWTFSEPVWDASDSRLLGEGISISYNELQPDGSNARMFVSGTYQWDATNTVLTFTPSEPLPTETRITVFSGMFRWRDFSGQTVSAASELGSSGFSFGFTTAPLN